MDLRIIFALAIVAVAGIFIADYRLTKSENRNLRESNKKLQSAISTANSSIFALNNIIAQHSYNRERKDDLITQIRIDKTKPGYTAPTAPVLRDAIFRLYDQPADTD